jgi:hypothetical protein
MNVTVTSVATLDDGEVAVSFSSSLGAAVGRWRSSSAPVTGATYSVEFNVDRILMVGENAVGAVGNEPSVWAAEQCVHLRGHVDAIDDDGLVYFRLAEDCLAMLEFDAPETLRTGAFVELRVPVADFSVWPVGS